MDSRRIGTLGTLETLGSTLRIFGVLALCGAGWGQELAGTGRLEMQGDIAAAMVTGISAYLDGATARSVAGREHLWERDYSSAEAYRAGMKDNIARLSHFLGVRDERHAPPQTLDAAPACKELVGKARRFNVYAVRWPVFRGVHVEGLLIEPRGRVKGGVVVLGDCDETPEMLAGLAGGDEPLQGVAGTLAGLGYRVLVPVLVNRSDRYSGNVEIGKLTNQPHREYVYRPSYQMGRHIIGYEVQKVLGCVDWLEQAGSAGPAIIGYGEGGLLALYSAALDERIGTVVVSGYFGPRERLWEEPIYRNVWGLLTEFGDAEVAAMIAPRRLIVEAAAPPRVEGPPAEREGRTGAAPGSIRPLALEEVRREVARARGLAGDFGAVISLVEGEAGGREALGLLVAGLGDRDGRDLRDFRDDRDDRDLRQRGEERWPIAGLKTVDGEARMRRAVEELVEDTQWLVRESPQVRQAFWSKADRSSAEAWTSSTAWYREYFRNEVIGNLPEITLGPDAKSRLVYDEPGFKGYEVVLEVYPEVFAYGILCVPMGIQKGERRPVVVCQHGLEGRPQEVANIHEDSHYYHAFGARLAQQGFVTFSPQNPYIGENDFRVLQRKANPLKLSLFSFIVRQHEQILKWLKTLPFVDGERMGFYGLSYGGKTAMRVPVLLPDYKLSICSGDFNEWIWKTTSVTSAYSYQFTREYEMYEFDLGNTFNYAELAGLIFPRPFMVERGHEDGVAPDEWVGYEFARVRKLYDQFDLGERTTIEFFNGPHTIHGVGTLQFLKNRLAWTSDRVEVD